MNNLIVLTEEFPYGTSESFLENEVSYWNKFDKVFLIPCSARNKKICRQVPDFVQIVDLECVNKTQLEKTLGYLKALFHFQVLKEVGYLIKNKKICGGTVKNLLSFYTVAKRAEKEIFCKVCKRLNKEDNTVYYSYWMDFQAYILCELKGKVQGKSNFVSRCHGYDVYEERRIGAYIPFRNYVLKGLDHVYCISENGRAYLHNRYPAYASKIETAFLGTKDYGTQEYLQKNTSLTIVSCAWMSRLKRLDRIVDALALTSIPIKWIHFGEGSLAEEIKKYAAEKLNGKSNISYEFAGSVANRELMEYYQAGCYDLFVSTSETEGIPVSIMEAASFGVPVIATDVGGVGEIVDSGYNGFLIESGEKTPILLKEMLEKVYGMSTEQYMPLRIHARQKWEEKFFGEKNYRIFMEKLIDEM